MKLNELVNNILQDSATFFVGTKRNLRKTHIIPTAVWGVLEGLALGFELSPLVGESTLPSEVHMAAAPFAVDGAMRFLRGYGILYSSFKKNYQYRQQGFGELRKSYLFQQGGYSVGNVFIGTGIVGSIREFFSKGEPYLTPLSEQDLNLMDRYDALCTQRLKNPQSLSENHRHEVFGTILRMSDDAERFISKYINYHKSFGHIFDASVIGHLIEGLPHDFQRDEARKALLAYDAKNEFLWRRIYENVNSSTQTILDNLLKVF